MLKEGYRYLRGKDKVIVVRMEEGKAALVAFISNHNMFYCSQSELKTLNHRKIK